MAIPASYRRNILVEMFLYALIAITMIGVLALALDDLFIDFTALLFSLRPKKILPHQLSLPQKRFAILIANWKEEDILGQMIRGNLGKIKYDNFSIFLGVYPNDTATWEVARDLERVFPQVSVIINHLPGPTSKGQLLNHMMRKILDSEKLTGLHYDAFLLQDSEDLIHPCSLALMNRELNEADFVQIPVFSLKTPYREFTAGTYADEFAESHTKDLLAREFLGAAVPSAGVGTALSRKLVLKMQNIFNGDFLNEKTLTEDYQLGILTGKLGLITRFACYFLEQNGQRDYIATREYFPNKFKNSIRQKTRWTLGITFQGHNLLAWEGKLVDRYFFWRDRRGPINAILLVNCTFILIYFSGHYAYTATLPSVVDLDWINAILGLNFLQMLWRLGQRIKSTSLIYGWSFAVLVPLRWPLANLINTLAAARAFLEFRRSRKSGTAVPWVKTQHRLPVNFGIESRPNLLPQEKEASA